MVIELGGVKVKQVLLIGREPGGSFSQICALISLKGFLTLVRASIDPMCLGWSLRICISSKFPGAAGCCCSWDHTLQTPGVVVWNTW